MRAIVMLLALGALTAACVIRVYEGDKRPREDVAVIVLARHSSAEIAEIDGRSFVALRLTRFEVLPGAHVIGIRAHETVATHELPEGGADGAVRLRLWDGRSIEVRVWGDDKDGYQGFSTKPLDLQLQAEAGHVYEVNAACKGLRLWIWISDRDSTQVVAGVRPGHVGWP